MLAPFFHLIKGNRKILNQVYIKYTVSLSARMWMSERLTRGVPVRVSRWWRFWKIANQRKNRKEFQVTLQLKSQHFGPCAKNKRNVFLILPFLISPVDSLPVPYYFWRITYRHSQWLTIVRCHRQYGKMFSGCPINCFNCFPLNVPLFRHSNLWAWTNYLSFLRGNSD